MGQNDLNVYDHRVMDRCVEKGLVTQEELDKHHKELPDESANADWVTIDMEDAGIGDSRPLESVSDSE